MYLNVQALIYSGLMEKRRKQERTFLRGHIGLLYTVKFIVDAYFCNIVYNCFFILSQEIVTTKGPKCIPNGSENGQVMHVLNFLEDYFKENTSKWLGGQLPGTWLISFMEHRVFLFVLKTGICGNI